MTIAARSRPLDDLTHQILLNWLQSMLFSAR
jgi:hypothetical protein